MLSSASRIAANFASLSGSLMYSVGAARRQTIPSFGNQRLMVELCTLMLHSFLSSNANNSVLQRER